MVKGFLKFLQRSISYILWLLLDPAKFKRIERKRIKKVLVINLGFIGDLLATTPMIAALKKNLECKICVLVRKGMEDVFIDNRNVDKILVYKGSFNEDLSAIRKEKFDLAAIVWPASLRISLLCLFARIPYRIGTTQTGLLEGKGYLLTRKVKPSFHVKHKVQENLDIARLVGADLRKPRIEFYFSKKDAASVNRFLKKNKVRKFIVLHPGKRGKFYAEYSWPLENFAAVANFLIEKHNLSIVITGSREEEKIAKELFSRIKKKDKVAVASGKLTLKEFAALLKKAELLISIDTAAVHIASAFNVPIIALNVKYPKIWHPYMRKERYKILISPSVKEVINSASIFFKK